MNIATKEELQNALNELNRYYGLNAKLVFYVPRKIPKRGLHMTPTTPFWKYQQSAAFDPESNAIWISPKYMSLHMLAHEYAHVLESSPKHDESFLRVLKEVRGVLGLRRPKKGSTYSRIVREKEGYHFNE